MLAYKGMRGDMTCTLGKGTFQYAEGQTIVEESSKCARTGLHCTEYSLECFYWYPLGEGNRYFEVEAAGSIDEVEGDAKISCTEMTIRRELNLFQMAASAMMYMVKHPTRDWKMKGRMLDVSPDKAEGKGCGSIAIARGHRPVVRGAAGSVMGLLVEDENGDIISAKVFEVKGNVEPGIWYTLAGRNLEVAE